MHRVAKINKHINITQTMRLMRLERSLASTKAVTGALIEPSST